MAHAATKAKCAYQGQSILEGLPTFVKGLVEVIANPNLPSTEKVFGPWAGWFAWDYFGDRLSSTCDHDLFPLSRNVVQ
jgi:hypothetical protein